MIGITMAMRPVAVAEIIVHSTNLPQEEGPTRFLKKVFLKFNL